MQKERADYAPTTPQKRARKPRIDQRTRLARRSRELRDVFAGQIGDRATDPVIAASIREAAELVALAEDLRHRAMRGDDVSPDDVVRLARLADQRTRRLLSATQPKPQETALAVYLASRSQGTPTAENRSGGHLEEASA